MRWRLIPQISLTVDTEIEEATIMADGQELDGRAFKDEIIPEVHFEDTNFESCEIRLGARALLTKTWMLQINLSLDILLQMQMVDPEHSIHLQKSRTTMEFIQ